MVTRALCSRLPREYVDCRAGRIGLDPQRAEKKILYNGIERLFWIIQIILDFYIF